MENKINIAELLKDCPKGMELDCTMYNKVTLLNVADREGTIFPIKVIREDGACITLTKYGQYTDANYAKCVIFPKGKTTWEGFVPPCKFKDGDVIFTHTNATKGLLENSWVSIFKEYRNNRCACYACLCLSDLELYHDKWEDELLCELCEIEESRLATEEEKEKLFQAIKDNGYKWNAETKTLEKLIEPKFKVGDRIKYRSGEIVYRIVQITEDSYVLDNLCSIPILIEHMYNLVPNKFDINTLVPFESKVLVRYADEDIWKPAIFGCYSKDKSAPYYVLGGICWRYCIPYDKNEHLLNTTNDCDDFYKTWEK